VVVCHDSADAQTATEPSSALTVHADAILAALQEIKIPAQHCLTRSPAVAASKLLCISFNRHSPPPPLPSFLASSRFTHQAPRAPSPSPNLRTQSVSYMRNIFRVTAAFLRRQGYFILPFAQPTKHAAKFKRGKCKGGHQTHFPIAEVVYIFHVIIMKGYLHQAETVHRGSTLMPRIRIMFLPSDSILLHLCHRHAFLSSFSFSPASRTSKSLQLQTPNPSEKRLTDQYYQPRFA